tara:strand:- start:681 stop:1631 length:951 start_codon:yes stop_codon:yes gene_type:complete
MKNILVTGGRGFIGQFLCSKLIDINFCKKIICFDSASNFSKNQNLIDKNKINRIKYVRGEIEDPLLVENTIRKYKPELIFHLAGVSVARTENLTYFYAKRGPIDGTQNLIIALKNLNHKKFNFKKFIYFSSSMVYGDFKRSIAKESDSTNPRGIYGITKKIGEEITKNLCNEYKINFSIIRPSAVYGPNDPNKRVSQIFIERALKKKEIFVFSKNEKLDFTYVEDLVSGAVLVAKNKKANGEIFNITFGKSRSLKEFLNILVKRFPNLRYSFKKKIKPISKRGTLSILKARKLLNYKPKYDLEKGINKIINLLTKS